MQDLSKEDAEELRAFLEKGRWFETKLKILEDLPPIYPFLHPRLISRSGEIERQGESSSSWKLPVPEDVRAWQQERDILEEDVLAFDGGDLGRMKEKTRAVTSAPLTPPSTHLVEITLALIKVVDRLLALLRHRSDLLDLTSLRLQWDALRWQALRDIDALRLEIGELAAGKGRWSSPESLTAKPRASISDAVSTLPGAVSSNHGNLADGPASSPSPSPSIRSLKSVHTPRPSLHLSLLHSRVVNLQVRATTLSTTSATRSGALLDRMIDLAGPFKGLGDTHGPVEDKEGKQGAVPDELLDLQDELENDIRKVQAEVGWCKELEKQWDAATEHYAACMRVHQAAEGFFEAVKATLDQPASSESHAKLQTLYQEITTAMPKALDNTFPRPWHDVHPGSLEANQYVVDSLEKLQRGASSTLKECKDAMTWYERLLKSTQAVQTMQLRLDAMIPSFSGHLQLVLNGDANTPPPSIDPDYDPQMVESWLRAAPKWIQDLKEDCDTAGEVTKEAHGSLRTYSRALSAVPARFREGLPNGQVVDHLGPLLSLTIDQVRDLNHNFDYRLAQTDLEIFTPFLPALKALPTAFEVAESKRTEFCDSIRASAWSAGAPSLLRNVVAAVNDAEMDRLLRTLRVDVLEAVERTEVVLGNSSRDRPLLRSLLAEMRATATSHIRSLEELRSLEDSVRAQAHFIGDVQHEVAEMRNGVAAIRHSAQTRSNAQIDRTVEGLQLDAELLSRARDVEARHRTWNEGLSSRMVFASASGIDPLRVITAERTRVVASSQKESPMDPRMSASAPPMTPPSTPPLPSAPSTSDASDSIQSLNSRVRKEINEQAAIIAGDLEYLRLELKRSPFDRWMTQLESLLKELEESMSAVSKTTTSLSKRRASLLRHATSTAGDLERLQEDAQGARETLPICMNAAIEAIQSWTSDDVISSLGDVLEVDEARRMVTKIINTAQSLLMSLERGIAEVHSTILPLPQQAKPTLFSKSTDDVFGSHTPQISTFTEIPATPEPNRFSPAPSFNDAASITSAESSRTTAVALRNAISNHSLRPARIPSRASSSRSTSNPTPTGGYLFPTESTRHRTVSGDARTRVNSLRGDGLPRQRHLSTSTSQTPNRIPRPSKASFTPQSTSTASTPRNRKSSATSNLTRTTEPPRTYVPDPKNTLDMAVGKVINDMRVNVPVMPIGLENNDWKDQTGRYWIGAEGRAKLCFCRILRSKTVMVRVGGGWVELSKFLMDHFADAVFATPLDDVPPLDAEGTLGSSEPITITSASLAASTSSSLGVRASPKVKASSLDPITPMRKASGPSPLASPSMSPALGSPLLPLHFIRKASESPPVREKEKERLGVGRRSILGREVGSLGSPSNRGQS